MKSDTLKYLAKRKIQPQPTRPLNVKSRCSHRDAIGTTTKLDLLVKIGEPAVVGAQLVVDVLLADGGGIVPTSAGLHGGTTISLARWWNGRPYESSASIIPKSEPMPMPQ